MSSQKDFLCALFWKRACKKFFYVLRNIFVLPKGFISCSEIKTSSQKDFLCALFWKRALKKAFGKEVFEKKSKKRLTRAPCIHLNFGFAYLSHWARTPSMAGARNAESPLLYVEDDPDDALLVQRAFRKLNILSPLHHVEDGEEATKYLLGTGTYADRRKYPFPRVMLADLKLPRRNGLELLEWLRKQRSSLRRLPVIILTSSNQMCDINEAYELGVNSYLIKPAGFDDLCSALKVVHQYWLIHCEKPEIRV
ncbi:MAG: response regulator [Limisphaerales bacterium]